MKWNASTAGLRPTRHQGAPPQIVVVQHFDEELKRLVPVK